MFRLAGGVFLLSLCVGLSNQICHNGICDEDKCAADSDCPSCFSCDTTCGTCNTIPNCCTSHQVCPDWDGVCDLEVDPTTCNYCEFNDSLCKPGCVDNSNCEAGFECNNHQCTPVTTCPDNAYCNAGLSNICDIENAPYTTCFYCLDGECLPGCVTGDNCPSGYTCDSNHMCQYPAGKVQIDSITIRTKNGCKDCSKEGVTLSLLGEQNANYPLGVPCATHTLDHAATIDYDGSSYARFDGKLGGVSDDGEKNMMGGCYMGPLNVELSGGTLVWQGTDNWEPLDVCVDWLSDNFAWQCSVSPVSGTWNLFNCHDLQPKTKCSDIIL